MTRHVILGLLSDGRARHGYELMTELKARSDEPISTGHFYRELARMAADGLVQTDVNPPDVDSRRIPYRITDLGSGAFDRWLLRPQGGSDNLPERLLFIDRIPGDFRERLFDRWQEELWIRNKTLARMRADLISNGSERACGYRSLAVLILRHMKHVAADLEFLKEVREEIAAMGNR